jgi:arylsulfatase A-like enzyme
VPTGAAITAAVSLRDIPATVMDLAGFESEDPFAGRSLARFWRAASGSASGTPLSEVSGLKSKPAQSAISRGDMVSVVRDSFHLIRNGDGVEELYDVWKDPSASSDLWPTTPDSLKATLDRLLDSLSAARTE